MPKSMCESLPSVRRDDGTTDYHQWGKNCKAMNMTPDQAENMLGDDYEKVMSPEQYDEFFEGYYHGEKNQPDQNPASQIGVCLAPIP